MGILYVLNKNYLFINKSLKYTIDKNTIYRTKRSKPIPLFYTVVSKVSDIRTDDNNIHNIISLLPSPIFIDGKTGRITTEEEKLLSEMFEWKDREMLGESLSHAVDFYDTFFKQLQNSLHKVYNDYIPLSIYLLLKGCIRVEIENLTDVEISDMIGVIDGI